MPNLHCWEDGPREPDGCGTTCMLEAGHGGSHEWTRDDGITVRFAPEDADVSKMLRLALEPDTDGGYGHRAQVVAYCPRCDFSASYPNYLIAAEVLARRDVEEHFRETHYLQERYDRLVGRRRE